MCLWGGIIHVRHVRPRTLQEGHDSIRRDLLAHYRHGPLKDRTVIDVRYDPATRRFIPVRLGASKVPEVRKRKSRCNGN